MNRRRLILITLVALVAVSITAGVVLASTMGTGLNSTIAGGLNNLADGDYSSVGGGRDNAALAKDSTVGGGLKNRGYRRGTTIGGGLFNGASGFSATIGGGQGNRASAGHATVGGGQGNTASGAQSAVGGGGGNTASGLQATVGGGAGNTASGFHTTVGGGDVNSARGGGQTNTASGSNATVPGGFANVAAGDNSLAAGRNAKIDAADDGTFLFADSNPNNFFSQVPNEFAARATGGVRFVTAIDGTGNPSITCGVSGGGSSWACTSDRSVKANFSFVEGRDILERLSEVPIEKWNFSAQDKSIRHIGPTAQDFYAAFGLGDDAKKIAFGDADGVALAAIQGLYDMVQKKDGQIAALQQRDKELEARLLVVEEAVGGTGAPAAVRSSGIGVTWLLLGALCVVALVLGLGIRRFRAGER